jgi:hypothetical protein
MLAQLPLKMLAQMGNPHPSRMLSGTRFSSVGGLQHPSPQALCDPLTPVTLRIFTANFTKIDVVL